MGRIRRFKRSNRSFPKKIEQTKKADDRNNSKKNYKEIIRENADFEKYYKAQNIVPESEWETFLDYLRRDLPTSFRITNTRKSEANILLKIIEGQFFKDLINADCDPDTVRQKPFCLPWYPDRLGWQLQITRKDIRRSESYFRLHNFLMSETAAGSISRQEVVSMIPPLLLDVEPHHKVIDMCAAPGSKTAQLIEMMHSNDGKISDGVIVANDVDNARCYMLVHQAKRLNSANIIITNHDSACMPNITLTKPDGSETNMKYDRVLCDVPCTGDGTLRKNPDIWMKWNPTHADNLHGVQYRILTRGIEMLTVGGRLVYSTCSLNPTENEAVIHRLLVNTKGTVRLVDVSDKLPGLVYSKGLTTWKIGNKDVTLFDKFEDVPEKFHTLLRPQMFPPTSENASQFNLDRCLRILPHQQDTGGFFVAVLEKIESQTEPVKPPSEIEKIESLTEPAKPPSEIEKNESYVYEKEKLSDGSPVKKKRKVMGFREDPFIFFEKDEPIWPSIRDFFGITPNLQYSCLLTRCIVGKKKNIYFVSPTVRDIVVNNQTKIKLINTGVKTFARYDNKADKCCFRLAQEGLQSIIPYIGDCRRIQVTESDLLKLLSSEDIHLPPEITSLDEETQQRLENISHGSCILEYIGKNGLKLEMVGWRGVKSVRPYIPTTDCIHYIRLLGGDVSKFEKNKFKKEELIETTNRMDVIESCSS